MFFGETIAMKKVENIESVAKHLTKKTGVTVEDLHVTFSGAVQGAECFVSYKDVTRYRIEVSRPKKGMANTIVHLLLNEICVFRLAVATGKIKPRLASFPQNILAGHMHVHEDTNTLHMYDGGTWLPIVC